VDFRASAQFESVFQAAVGHFPRNCKAGRNIKPLPNTGQAFINIALYDDDRVERGDQMRVQASR
jgi:hypothetical protein